MPNKLSYWLPFLMAVSRRRISENLVHRNLSTGNELTRWKTRIPPLTPHPSSGTEAPCLSHPISSQRFTHPHPYLAGFHLTTTPQHSPAANMASSSNQEPLAIGTPIAVYADFCLIPVGSLPLVSRGEHVRLLMKMSKIGTGDTSVSKHVADVQRLLKKSGLNYHMHSAGTTVG